MRITDWLLQGVGPATSMAWLGRREFLVAAHGVSIDRTVQCVGGWESFRPNNAERRRTNRDPVRVHLFRIGAPDRTRPKPRDDGSSDCQFGRLLVHPVSPVVSNLSWLAGGNIALVGVFTRLNVPKHAIFAAAFIRQSIRVAHTMRNLLPDGHR
jgi:hypothetical protein